MCCWSTWIRSTRSRCGMDWISRRRMRLESIRFEWRDVDPAGEVIYWVCFRVEALFAFSVAGRDGKRWVG